MGVLKRIERRKKSKIKKALKSYRGRFWKNLAIFMAGVFSSGFILAGISALVLKFVPLKNVTGSNTDKVVSSELADKSILDVLVGFKDATVDDYVFVTTLIDALQNADVAGKKLRDFVYIDTAKLSGTKLLELGPALKDAVTVTATLYSTVGSEYLDKFGVSKIEAFNEFLPVMIDVAGTTQHATVENINTTDGSFKASLYYYKVADGVEVENSIKVVSGEYAGTYARAYNNDKSLKEGVTNETLLYYAAVTKVPITDAVGLLTDTFGRVKATELLDVFGIGGEGIIGKLLKDRTISELGELDIDNITIYELLEGEPDSDIYRVLSDATGKPYDEILISDLSTSLDIYKIKVSTVFKSATEEMKSLFVDLVNSNKEDGAADLTWEDITIDSLQNIDGFDSVKLSSVMIDVYPAGYLYTYTEDGEEKTKTIKKGDSEHSVIADILIDANAENWLDDEGNPLEGFDDINAKWDSLAVSGVTSLTSFDNVRLSLVLNNSGDLEGILKDVTGKEFCDIVVSDLNNLEIGEVNLITVMPTMGDDLKAILEDEFGKDYDQIILSDLENFEMGKLHLYKVLPQDRVGDTLENVLIEITGAENYEKIEIIDLYNKDITNVKLSTLGISAWEDKDGDGVVDEGEENKILKAILGDPNTTVGNIGTTINNLTLYEIFGQECFKKIGAEGATFVEDTPLFEKVEEDTNGDGKIDYIEFVHKESTYFESSDYTGEGPYGLCANDGMWLLLCFDFEHVDEKWVLPSNPNVEVPENTSGAIKVGTGRPEEYIISDLTFNDLTSGTAVTDKFEKATIAQLVDSGILESANEKLMPYTLAEALEKLSDLMP